MLVQKLLEVLYCQVESDCSKSDLVNYAYDKLVSTLQYCASTSVPVHYKGFYKFWWDQELDLLKEESIKSHIAWKSAGRPRSGPFSTNIGQISSHTNYAIVSTRRSNEFY